MPRSEGEVKGTELFVGVCVCARVLEVARLNGGNLEEECNALFISK